MSFIRGKIEPDREIVQREITFGEAAFYFCERCEKWVNVETHEQVEVNITTLSKLLDLNTCDN